MSKKQSKDVTLVRNNVDRWLPTEKNNPRADFQLQALSEMMSATTRPHRFRNVNVCRDRCVEKCERLRLDAGCNVYPATQDYRVEVKVLQVLVDASFARYVGRVFIQIGNADITSKSHRVMRDA